MLFLRHMANNVGKVFHKTHLTKKHLALLTAFLCIIPYGEVGPTVASLKRVSAMNVMMRRN